MGLPFFYAEHLQAGALTLDEETSKHIAGVLRMKPGDALLLTNGRGAKGKATIMDGHRKRCTVQVEPVVQEAEGPRRISIAISLLKNATRFEWFLEKATEIGVQEILPLLCQRTERQHIRLDRMQNILVSAMLQSQQSWLPQLHQPLTFNDAINTASQAKVIAHCVPEQKQAAHEVLKKLEGSLMILIGPEGDFTEAEIQQALQQGFVPVTLGDTRLRTETAGVVAATLACIMR